MQGYANHSVYCFIQKFGAYIRKNTYIYAQKLEYCDYNFDV